MSQYFTHYTDIILSIVGLMLFLSVFVGSILWTGLRENKRIYDQVARDMLNDGEAR